MLYRSAKRANLLGIHTPPVVDVSKIFHSGCVEFKWSSLMYCKSGNFCATLIFALFAHF